VNPGPGVAVYAWVDAFSTDLRFAIRALLARPGFSALAILTLAIGIGVNAVAFSAINGLLYKAVRFPGSDRLGWITMQGTGNPYGQVSWLDYKDITQGAGAFDAITAEGRRPLRLEESGRVRQVWALCVSSNYLSVLGARATRGRIFNATDAQSDELPVVVSDRFWKAQGGGATVAGRTIVLNGRVASIVGVLEDSFQGAGGLFEPDLWVPLDRIDLLGLSGRLTSRDQPWLGMVGQLRSGVTAAQAAADLHRISSAIPGPPPAGGPGRTLRFWPLREGNPEVRGIASVAYTALAIVGLVLLLACFNVAGLLLARASDRQRETSVRAALGASRARIVRQFALEGLVLAALGGAAAIVVAGWSADLLAVFSLPSPVPQRLRMPIDRRVIGFTAALVAIGGVVPALLPALQATRVSLMRSMRLDTPSGQRRSRARSTFIVMQIAGSTLLLTASLLFVRSFWTASSADPGFETGHLVVLELKPTDFGYDAVRSRAFFENLVERVRATPVVASAALADRVPFYVGFPRRVRVAPEGTDCATADCRTATAYHVADGHFAALGVRILAGREFTARDVAAADSVIVGQTLASRLWPGRDPVGQRLGIGPGGQRLQVIGVAADIVHHLLNERPGDYVYTALSTADFAESITLVVRTKTDPSPVVAMLQEHVQALDPALPSGTVKTMAQRMEMPLWPVRTAAGFFTICGALALILATVGLFGTTYLAVGQRTREFGIRAALGSTRARVMKLVLGEGLLLALPGIVLGIGGAALAASAAGSVVLNVNAADVPAYAVSAIVQALAAVAACAWPAHRATRADPILALRAE
jgi:predicted permease